MSKRGILLAFTALIAAVAALPAPALINPKFTPVHLVRESDTIIEGKFAGEVQGGKATLEVTRVLKGTFDKKSLEIDLATGTKEDEIRTAEKAVGEAKDKPVLLFIGNMDPTGAGANPGAGPGGPAANPGTEANLGARGYLHMQGKWLVISQDEKGWGFEEYSQPWVGVWNGGTDMLLRCVQYLLKDPDGLVPVKSGAQWGGKIAFGKIAGKVTDMLAVDLKGDGRATLFVASDAGDHLLEFSGKESQDITVKSGLTSQSLAAAWGDFNGDGLLDLASWDGKSLKLFLQDKDGKFTAAGGQSGGGELTSCLSLSMIDAGGKAGLIVGTSAAPLLLIPGAGAKPQPLPAADPRVWQSLGQAGPCLVADFSGDGQVDVLQLGERGSLFYKGIKPGQFAAPVKADVALGTCRSACLGDWDGDGLLDVFMAGPEGCRLWQNQGGGKFTESIKLSGEIGYALRGAAVGAANGDLSNDGRQGVVVLYRSTGPQVFFNRGYRTFGVSQSLDLGSGDLLPEAAKGQQCGCLGDFTGDGCQGLATVLSDGQGVLVVRARSGELAARLVLPAKAGPGPVRVWAEVDNRRLGAWNLRSGLADCLFGRTEAGALTIRWQFPGQKEQSRQVILKSAPVNVMIQPPAGP